MLRETPNTEAVIVEYGFLDNKSDAEDLKKNYKKYAEAVVRAVMNYKGLNYTPVSGGEYYTVKNGDTLWTIARKYGLSVDELKNINNISSNVLSIGQVLKVKKTQDSSEGANLNTYIVKSGDTLYGIASKYNISVDNLKKANNLASNILQVGQKLIIPNNEISDDIYVVQKGDSLYKIANKFGVSVSELKEYNSLKSDILSIGQVLKIPKDEIIYVVKSGDTLYSIAQKNNTSVQKLKDANNLSTNILSIGQKLIVK